MTFQISRPNTNRTFFVAILCCLFCFTSTLSAAPSQEKETAKTKVVKKAKKTSSTVSAKKKARSTTVKKVQKKSSIKKSKVKKKSTPVQKKTTRSKAFPKFAEKKSSSNKSTQKQSQKTSALQAAPLVVAPAIAATSFNKNKWASLQKDSELGEQVYSTLAKYHSDQAGFMLAVDGATNEVLAWSQYNDGAMSSTPSYLSRTTFPPASLAKIITAAAAFESKQYNATSGIPFIGHPYKIYKNQLNPKITESTHFLPIDTAFSLSINPVFGILGQKLGGRVLGQMGRNFGFDMEYPLNLPGRSYFSPPDTGYHLAEKASGFTDLTTASPLHIAAIVRAIAMERAFLMTNSQKLYPYWAPRVSADLQKPTLSPSTYDNLKQCFRLTITAGTARKNLRKQISSAYLDQLEIGGKTGSLNGKNPKGHYEWFVGYAQEKANPNNTLIVVVMQVNLKKWKQKSSFLAGQMINSWSKQHLTKKSSTDAE